MTDQAGMRRQRRLVRHSGSQATRGRKQGGRHRCRNPVHGGHRGVDRLRPGRQVALARVGPVSLGCVLPVVAGEVQVREMDHGIPSVDLNAGECGTQARFDGLEVRLVMRIGLLRSVPEIPQTSRHPFRRQVLHGTVELVQSRRLAGARKVELVHSPDPGVHAAHATFARDMASRSEVVRYRCTACGNLTRFDVVTSRRLRAFHHFTVGGELNVEDEEVVSETVEDVSCRWCGHGRSIERVEGPVPGE